MNIISLKNRISKAEAAKGEVLPTRKELNARLSALGLDVDSTWRFVATNPTRNDIHEYVAATTGVPVSAVMQACHV